jgi:hypothetical protein
MGSTTCRLFEKPFDGQELLDALSEDLHQKRSHTPPSSPLATSRES